MYDDQACHGNTPIEVSIGPQDIDGALRMHASRTTVYLDYNTGTHDKAGMIACQADQVPYLNYSHGVTALMLVAPSIVRDSSGQSIS